MHSLSKVCTDICILGHAFKGKKDLKFTDFISIIAQSLMIIFPVKIIIIIFKIYRAHFCICNMIKCALTKKIKLTENTKDKNKKKLYNYILSNFHFKNNTDN